MRRANEKGKVWCSLHVKVPQHTYDELRARAKDMEGTIHQQVRLAVKRYLEGGGGGADAVAPAAEAEVRDVCGE